MKTFNEFNAVVSEATKKQCPNCKEYPAWNKAIGLNDTPLLGKAVHKCGLCNHEEPRKTRQSAVEKALASELEKDNK